MRPHSIYCSTIWTASLHHKSPFRGSFTDSYFILNFMAGSWKCITSNCAVVWTSFFFRYSVRSCKRFYKKGTNSNPVIIWVLLVSCVWSRFEWKFAVNASSTIWEPVPQICPTVDLICPFFPFPKRRTDWGRGSYRHCPSIHPRAVSRDFIHSGPEAERVRECKETFTVFPTVSPKCHVSCKGKVKPLSKLKAKKSVLIFSLRFQQIGHWCNQDFSNFQNILLHKKATDLLV